MYLETILSLSLKQEKVRAVDVSREIGFSKPSVSRALGILRENSFIIQDQKGCIFLSASGRMIAERIYERHNTLTRCLEKMGVDHENASRDACKMEHDISDATFNAIKEYLGISD